MNIRDLEYLVAVDDFRHFRKAADHCFVSQPTLSAQVKKLEEYLGVQLVERSSRKVMLTPVGREVVIRARAALAEVQAIRELPKHYLDPMSGALSLGVIPTLAPYLLPRIIQPIKKRYPALQLRLVEAMTMPLLERLMEGRTDVLILALPLPSEQQLSGLETIPLFHEPFYLAVHESHRLASRKWITLDDISGEKMSLLEDGHCLREQALDVCQAAGSLENADLRATSLETLRYMVEAGETATLMPKLARHDENGNGTPIRYVPFRKPSPERQIGLVFRGSNARTECFGKLAQVIRQQTRKLV